MIPTRTSVTTPVAPKTAPVRQTVVPPTLGMVQHAGATFGNLLELPKEQTDAIIDFASKSALTAWALVDYAYFLVRCMGADEKIKRVYKGRIETFDKAMSEAKTKDIDALTATQAIDGKANPTGKKDALRTANQGLLKGIPEGTPVPLSKAERRVVVDTLSPAFGAPEKTPLEDELGGVIIGRRGANQRFALNLIRTFLGDEAYESEFKAQLAAARTATTTETEADEDENVAAAS